MPEGINALDWSHDDSKTRCEDCGTHFLIDPWGQVQDAACPACGGKRFFRTQPSPVRDDLRGLNGMKDMPGAAGSDSPEDTGGNILQEGLAKSYSHFLVSFTQCPSCGGDVVEGMGCPNCGNRGEAPLGTMTPNGNSSNMDLARGIGGFPLDEGTIVGKDGEPNPYASTHGYDGYTHSHVKNPNQKLPYAHSHQINSEVEVYFPNREEISQEPYPALWSDEHVAGVLGDAALGVANLIPGVGEVADAAALGDSAATMMKGVGFVNNMFGGGPEGSSGTGIYPTSVQAPTMQQLGSADIPMLLLADFETYDSVKSVDEHHNNPAKQDQKEFDYGDKSPSNFHNPNNQDSGAAGEDGIRDATPGYGFGSDSPALQHMHGLLPLIMHYLTNGISGADDPILQDLHEKLEAENPGYLDREHEDGPRLVEIMIQRHKSPNEEKDKAKAEEKAKKAAGRLATVPLSPFPTPSSVVDQAFTPGTDINPPLGSLQYCPSCGSVLNGDRTCPHCGFPSAGMGIPTNAPQQLVSNHQGPLTAEQFEAATTYLKQNGQDDLIRQLYEHPENFGWLMDEIQQNPQPTAPLVAPEPQTAMPAPTDNPQGAMPVIDPSQPGGGGAPMQPMSAITAKESDANNMVPRCPRCGSASTSIMDGNEETVPKAGHCHSCQYNWYLPLDIHGTPPVTSKLVALANPTLDPQAIWKDVNDNPLQVGEHYSLYTAGMPVPDEVVIIDKKPAELWMQVDGTNADFKIAAEDVMNGKYSLEPASNTAADKTAVPHAEHPLDNANVIQQPTTDEILDQYPHATVSHVHEDLDDDTCRKCGSTDTTSFMSAPDRRMHECYRCASAWETTLDDGEDEDTQRHAALEWIRESDNDDFFAEYERHRQSLSSVPEIGMTGAQSRNIREIAQNDPRLGEIRERLNQNPSVKDMMAHEAGKSFTHAEKRELIDEMGMARNYDRLDLSNTHYVVDDNYIASRRGNEYDVPDDHLILGL